MIKSKILILSTITLAIVVACATIESESKQSNSAPQTVAQWQQKYPQVFANAGYRGLIESSAQLKSLHNSPESQQELIGTITNPFGIRDDILQFIIQIPESNIRTRVAFIKRAQSDQAEIGETDINQLIRQENIGATAIYCMQVTFLEKDKLLQSYGRLLRNTSDRANEYLRLENLLSGHMIGRDFGVNSDNLMDRCDYFLGISK